MAELPKCSVPSCDRTVRGPRAEFCGPCHQARRSWQLKINNEKWKERKAKDEAGHAVFYDGKPTKWALDNPAEALRIAVKEGHDNEALERLIKAAALKLLSK